MQFFICRISKVKKYNSMVISDPAGAKKSDFPHCGVLEKWCFHSHSFLKLENSCPAQQVNQIPQDPDWSTDLGECAVSVRLQGLCLHALTSPAKRAEASPFSFSLAVAAVSNCDLCIIVRGVLSKQDILINDVQKAFFMYPVFFVGISSFRYPGLSLFFFFFFF